jgi:hypothetical protein
MTEVGLDQRNSTYVICSLLQLSSRPTEMGNVPIHMFKQMKLHGFYLLLITKCIQVLLSCRLCRCNVT